MAKRLDLKDVNIFYGSFEAVAGVTMAIPPRSVTAFIGPSGCGKSTVLRVLNRMHEVVRSARTHGDVLLDGKSIYGAEVGRAGQEWAEPDLGESVEAMRDKPWILSAPAPRYQLSNPD
jgi:phosphate transport system ATP-binding protein